MGRTREAALTGASAAIVKYGSRKATMGDIAMLAGIAKATLYNHFRTRDDVYLALAHAEVDVVAAAARSCDGFAAQLAEAARLLGTHTAVRRLASDEPAVLAVLATPGTGAGWTTARTHIAEALATSGLVASAAAVDLVVRYLATQLLAASDDFDRRAVAALITDALRADPPLSDVPIGQPQPTAQPDPAQQNDPAQQADPAQPAGSAGTKS
jgi:AcrR family transcriptional regulator